MKQCIKHDCCLLQTTCVACGRIVCEKILPRPQEWISVKDRLPERGEYVMMAYSDKGQFWRATYNGWGCGKPLPDPFWSNEDEIIEDTITHWMPLPEPPK